MEPVIELHNISKSFFGIEVLHGVNFTLQKGEIHALLGENGAGKSTLIKILSGLYQPSSGVLKKDGTERHFHSVMDAKKCGISTIFQELSLVQSMNAWQNVFLGKEVKHYGLFDRSFMRKETEAILASLGLSFDIDAPIKSLSIANQQFIEIAKALIDKSEVFIFDEPTSTLTPKESANLFQVMGDLQKKGVSMIFISHHLEELFEICKRVSILRDGNYIGTYDLSEMDNERLITLMVGRENVYNYPDKGVIHTDTPVALKVKNENPEKNELFHVKKGEILGIFGLIGSGRTELILHILGALGHFKGSITLNSKEIKISSFSSALAAGIGLLPENRKTTGLLLHHSVQDNITINNISSFFINQKEECQKAEKYSSNFSIKSRNIHQEVCYLSGGNQQKVIIAKWLCANCNILIFDEPTRGIDVGAKHEIYNFMRSFVQNGNSIIMISSEMNEIIGMSNRVLTMKNNMIVDEITSDFSPDRILRTAI